MNSPLLQAGEHNVKATMDKRSKNDLVNILIVDRFVLLVDNNSCTFYAMSTRQAKIEMTKTLSFRLSPSSKIKPTV